MLNCRCAERLGWERRPAPGTRREGEWLIGTGDESPLAGLTADEVGGRDEGLCELADPSR
jgi:hypothetical protein